MPAGIIADPEITHFTIEDGDQFIIIGSDGLYEFTSNLDVLKYILIFILY